MLCETRKPRRNCIAIGKDICSQCCGSKREIEVDCPLDCSYLVAGRDHETLADPGEYPNREVDVSEAFRNRNEALYILLLATIQQASAQDPATYDSDVREAMAVLVEKYRAIRNGGSFEPQWKSQRAAAMVVFFEKKITEFRESRVGEDSNVEAFDTETMFKLIVYLDRFARMRTNGRPKGKHFLSLLREMFPPMEKDVEATT